MNLTTQCPRCLTAFRATPEQLREAQGWVRCGVCQEVFDAQVHAVPDLGPLPTDAPFALRQEERAQADAPPPEAIPNPEPAIQTPSARRAATPHRWNTGLRRVTAGLLVLFIAQIGGYQRHHLALQFPAAAAWVQAVCGGADACSVRNIQGIAIEDSSLTTLDSTRFRLSAVIINRSDLAVEAPSLVLTLTDSADQAVVKKSLDPMQWASQKRTLPSRSSWPVVLSIDVDALPDSPPIVGYRLQALYR